MMIERPTSEFEPRRKLPEEVTRKLESLVDAGRLLIVTDLDGTVVPYKSNQIDAQAHQALQRLHYAGQSVVALTAREVHSAERLFPLHGAPLVVGTNGASWLQDGELRLSDDIEPYAGKITTALGGIHEAFTAVLKQECRIYGTQVSASESVDVHTDDGRIRIVTHAASQQLPHGIAKEYNLSHFSKDNPSLRQRILDSMQLAYGNLVSPGLRKVVNMARTVKEIKIGPYLGAPKWRALARIIRSEASNKDLATLRSVLYIGDTDGDARAIRMLSLVNNLTTLNAHGAAVVHGEATRRIGLRQEEALRVATMHFDEISANAAALTFIADLSEQKNRSG